LACALVCALVSVSRDELAGSHAVRPELWPGAKSAQVLAFDVGGTHIRGALCDGSGALLARARVATPRGDAKALIAALVAVAQELTPREGVGPSGVGLAIAGMLDLPQGQLVLSHNLELAHVDLAAPLEAALGLPVSLVNDVNAAALGESWGLGCDHLVALFLGTGVGFGAVAGGRLVEGARGMAGEAGHLIYDPEGPECPAGCSGCYDATLGGEGLAREAQALNLATDTMGLLAAWRAGDTAATALVERALQAMTVLTRLVVNLFDPAMVVVGGGLATHLPELLAAAREGVAGNPIGAGRIELPVCAASLGDDAGLVGAARRALLRGHSAPR
jgi:glucokinase